MPKLSPEACHLFGTYKMIEAEEKAARAIMQMAQKRVDILVQKADKAWVDYVNQKEKEKEKRNAKKGTATS